MKDSRKAVLTLVQIALYAALFIVLDFISSLIPFLQMPQGGSIGISVIVLIVASYHLGWKQGWIVVAVALVLMPMTSVIYSVNLLDYILEYVVAFGVYGLSSWFPTFNVRKIPIHTGIYVSNFLRFLIHWFAGVYFWGLNWEGSLAYNAPYMVATTLVCALVVPILIQRLALKRA
ncbi:MAG TPA: hypothetical protein DCP62_08635 [Erysipelotrichaceae bacterium]|nr:energy-coupled thiamine transporter ThiT [Erysipelotrichaceae bacterium]OGS59565.1 MAG: hypothetical protein A2Y19_11315 [Firmicutes bacterium GWE2_51_13]HAM63686.1 hypothetical protein [Erysipelotrichaceae bacterium]HAO61461.1 hypothetical protein [Erysipelotrichaceae bacterium]HBZ41711.1 hypothetical protein [Erysipelotrichaceae bacterium]